MITTIKFAKIKENATIPSKEVGNAGYDIYACFEDDYMIVAPNETMIVPTGICSAFDEDYVMVLKERGSTGSKGIGQRAGIIDSNFRGEWFVPITNHSNNPIIILKSDIEPPKDIKNIMDYCTIYPYEKAICQALLLPVPYAEVEEYTHNEILAISSDRGEKCLGSSGK